MKKIISALLALMVMASVSFAQDMKSGKTKTKAKMENKKGEKAEKKPAMKKDGTPDMRHKENKGDKENKEAPKKHLKKDGTPDMRYKENKEAAKKK